MKLSEFVTENLEQILEEWEKFAVTLFSASNRPTSALLRDHAKEILQELAKDIDTDQSPEQKKIKSEGEADISGQDSSAAATHGAQRQDSGFSIIQLTAEYRALRATVQRLWLPQMGAPTANLARELVRFNEAIDQAMAVSVVTFSARNDRMRDTFLAILGHDLRSPLSTITLAGNYLTKTGVGNEATQSMGARLSRSAATMGSMVKDLLEYAKVQLGGNAMPLNFSLVSVGTVCQAAIDDASASHPDCAFELDTTGDLRAEVDADRLQQVFSNLLNNAAQYRSSAGAVRISADGNTGSITVKVSNLGPVIPGQSLEAIFNPLVQLSVAPSQQGPASSSMGLGLFIAREITTAHRGTITAESTALSGTTFTVVLPRHSAPG